MYVISAYHSPNFYCDILHLYNDIEIPIINSVTSVKTDGGWYGQPKYCYKKTIYVVMISFCSSLSTSRFLVTYKILHSLRKKKCPLKGRFQLNLQAFDKYVHLNGFRTF